MTSPADDMTQTATPRRQPEPAAEPGTSGPTLADRARSVAQWARDTGLGIAGFVVVLVVALAGWSASFIGLHQFGMVHMNLTDSEAWLVPITFDGAAGGLSLVVFRASINGRSAALWRLLIVVFTALSSWINFVHIDDVSGRWIACYMPPSAVILFEGLMSEARAAFERREGKLRPRVHPVRWFVDRAGTWSIYRSYVLGLELPEHLQPKLPAATEAATKVTVEAPQIPLPERHEDALQGAIVAELERHMAPADHAIGAPQTVALERHEPAVEAPRERVSERLESAPTPAPVAPRERSESTSQSATKAPRKASPKRSEEGHEKGGRGAAKEAIRALYDELGRRPLESEMVAALIKARSKFTSRQFANKIRAEIEKEDPKLAALGSDNVRPLTGT